MSAKSRANLRAAFETGDRPDGDDFADLIDSAVNLTDTSAQSIASPITTPSFSTGALSATSLYTNLQYVRGLSTHENPYCEAYADVTAITSVEATASWTQVSASLTAVNKSVFSVSGKDVTYTGSVTAKFAIHALVNARLSSSVNQWFGVSKNDAVVSGSVTKIRLPAAGLYQFSVDSVVELKGNDVIGLRTQNPDGPIASPEVFGVRYTIRPDFWGA